MRRRHRLGPPHRDRVRPGSLTDAADPRQLEALLNRHRLELRRGLGQNFLVDSALRDRVLDAAGVEPQDEVLEVGSGAGTLTLGLAARCRRLVAVEIDGRLVRILRQVTAGIDNVELVHEDVLKLDLAAIFPAGGEVVVGNIPYHLTGALMPFLLERAPRPKRLSLVVQKEVAQRWTGTGDWSLGSVAVHVFAEPRLEFDLPAGAFTPAPRVDSALVVMRVRERPAVEVGDMGRFFRFVEALFQLRRKQLGGSLARVVGRPGPEVAGRLRGLGIDPTRRAQTLSLPEWEALYRALGAADPTALK